MRVFQRLPLFLAIFLLILSIPALAASSASDQAQAERILGPRWKQMSRRAGMIFAGTVLSAGSETAQSRQTVIDLPGREPARMGRSVPVHTVRFRIERAIAGVHTGQILTIHQWSGVGSRERSLQRGERVLLFLYPPSRLGLTSAVGGPQGQIRLDAANLNLVPLDGLERAIRRARGE